MTNPRPLTAADRAPQPGDVLNHGHTEYDDATVTEDAGGYPNALADVLCWCRSRFCGMFAVRTFNAVGYRYVSRADGGSINQEEDGNQ